MKLKVIEKEWKWKLSAVVVLLTDYQFISVGVRLRALNSVKKKAFLRHSIQYKENKTDVTIKLKEAFLTTMVFELAPT